MVTGTYDLENQVILKVQNWEGRAGAHLITPLLAKMGRRPFWLIGDGFLKQTTIQ